MTAVLSLQAGGAVANANLTRSAIFGAVRPKWSNSTSSGAEAPQESTRAGAARGVGGTRWRDPGGCVLTFATTVLAPATHTQRLTRSVTSTTCDGLKGSWQQAGKRVFWRVNFDSTRALEVYADISADSLMRTREYELRRAHSKAEWQATWDPQRARTLVRVRR